MAQGSEVRNNFDVLGDLTVRDIIYLGTSGFAGSAREIIAQGSDAIIHVDLVPKSADGFVRVPVGYESSLALPGEDRAVVNIGYFKSHILGLGASATAQSPGAGQNKFALVYDHPSQKWDLTYVAMANTYTDGVNESGG